MCLIAEIAVTVFSIFFAISVSWYIFRLGISPMPSSDKAKDIILELSMTDSIGSILDLGSGCGKLTFALAKAHPGRTIIGYEMSLFPYLYSLAKKVITNSSNVEFRRIDFLTTNLSQHSLIVCFLYPSAMKSIEGKLVEEGSEFLLISNTFVLPNIPFQKEISVDDYCSKSVYYYRHNPES